jgi:hypothetical protein
MSTPIDDGGPAFPAQDWQAKGNHHPGMSLRDYAIIHFTAAILASPGSYSPDGTWRDENETALEIGTNIADDFIAEREEAK